MPISITLSWFQRISIKQIVVIGSLPFISLICVAIHICFLTSATAGIAIIAIVLLCQFALLLVLEHKNCAIASIMLVGLLLKLLSGWFQLATADWSTSDELLYYEQGRALALSARNLREIIPLQQLAGVNSGTNDVVSITALIFKALSPSLSIAVALFCVLGFWGQYTYYLTFQRLFPFSDRLWAAFALFLWPSIIFWTTEVGKDALMIFFLGLGTYGVSASSERKRAIVRIAIATLGAFLIRPHIAVLFIISVIAAFSLSPARVRRKRFYYLAKSIIVAIFAVGLLYLCALFLQISNALDAMTHVEQSIQTNQLDGSGFNPGSSPMIRLLLSPLLLVRPFPWETNGASALLASLEGILLLVLLLSARRRISSLIADQARRTFITFLLWFVALNVLLLGIGSSNFGLLVRERVMVIPLILILLVGSASFMGRSASQKNQIRISKSIGLPISFRVL